MLKCRRSMPEMKWYAGWYEGCSSLLSTYDGNADCITIVMQAVCSLHYVFTCHLHNLCRCMLLHDHAWHWSWRMAMMCPVRDFASGGLICLVYVNFLYDSQTCEIIYKIECRFKPGSWSADPCICYTTERNQWSGRYCIKMGKIRGIDTERSVLTNLLKITDLK